VTINCDNQGSIALAKTRSFMHGRSIFAFSGTLFGNVSCEVISISPMFERVISWQISLPSRCPRRSLQHYGRLMCLSFALCFMVLTDILTKSLPTLQIAAFREARGLGICMSFALVLWCCQSSLPSRCRRRSLRHSGRLEDRASV
jgi:hypothetical protein